MSETTQTNRRTFLKATAATVGVGAASTVAPRSPIGRADALACGGVCIAGAAGLAGGAALGYLMNEGADALLGDEKDYSGYTGGDALISNVKTGALELASTEERVLTSIQNNVQNSKHVALAKGKAAVIEEMNAGNGESAATSAMQAAIDEYFSVIQENIINHWNAQLNQWWHYGRQLRSHDNTDYWDALAILQPNGDGIPSDSANGFFYGEDGPEVYALSNSERTLLDGRTVQPWIWYCGDTGSTTEYSYASPNFQWIADEGFPDPQEQYSVFQVEDSDGVKQTVIDVSRYTTLWDNLITARDDVNSQLSGFVVDVYNAYEPGDIPTEDLVDPITASTELQQDYSHYATQGAHAAMLGIPTEANHSVQMTLEQDGYTVWADIYTNHVPTDSNGNEVGFKSGQTYSPSGWSEPLYIAYEYNEVIDENGNTLNESEQKSYDGETTVETYSDFTQIEQDFTIKFVEDADGNEVTQFQTTSQNQQTSDVSTVEDELSQLREEMVRLQEEAEEDTSGGGFFDGSFSDIPPKGVLLAAVAVIALLKGN